MSKRKGPRTPIGLDVGSRYFKAVQLEPSADGWRIAAAVVAPRRPAPISKSPRLHGAAPLAPMGLTAEELRTLSDSFYRGGLTGTRLTIAAPSSGLLQSPLELPPRTGVVPIEQIARLELARTHKCTPDSFEMACWDLPASARETKGTHLMAVGFPHAQANPMLDVFETAGMLVQTIDVGSCALARACAPLISENGMTAILDMGWSAAVLTLIHRGAIVYGRSLADGGIGQLHATLTSKLKLEADIADYVINDVGVGSAQAEGEAARPRLIEPPPDLDLPDDARALLMTHVESIGQELQASFSYAAQQYPDVAVSKLLLVGGGAAMPGLFEFLSGALRIETRTVCPADVASCREAIGESCRVPMLTQALGLALFPEG
jgi:Tfp pilus assembly PilM family ATPase